MSKKIYERMESQNSEIREFERLIKSVRGRGVSIALVDAEIKKILPRLTVGCIIALMQRITAWDDIGAITGGLMLQGMFRYINGKLSQRANSPEWQLSLVFLLVAKAYNETYRVLLSRKNESLPILEAASEGAGSPYIIDNLEKTLKALNDIMVHGFKNAGALSRSGIKHLKEASHERNHKASFALANRQSISDLITRLTDARDDASPSRSVQGRSGCRECVVM